MKRKKILFGMAMATCLLFSCGEQPAPSSSSVEPPASSSKSEEPLPAPKPLVDSVGELRLHYYRKDGKYRNWAMWIWKVDADGEEYPFVAQDDYGGIVQIPLSKYGNDIEEVVRTLRKLRTMPGPRLLHCFTVKGQGYPAAEADPATWHAPGRFDPVTGERIHGPHLRDRYQDVFGEVLCELAAADRRVVGVTPAMAQGCGMNLLAAKFPEQFFDVGIEEEHAVTFSAGLAAGGMKPFCNIYSAFSQRAYDQIIHDVALQRLPVVLCFDRAGLVGEDGATHQGAFDLAAYRSIPDTIISAPRDEVALKRLMYTACAHATGPFIIRYPRGMGEGTAWREAAPEPYEIGRAETLLEGDTVAVLGLGPVVNRALEAARDWPGRVGVFDLRFLKPLDSEAVRHVAGRYAHILTVEDGALCGGLYGAVAELLARIRSRATLDGIGIPDRFISQAKQSEQQAECGLDVEGIRKSLRKVFGE